MLRGGRIRLASLGVVLALVLAPVALSINAAASPGKATPGGHAVVHRSVTQGNLHSKAAFIRFLRAHGLKRAKVVIQRGLRNYAGPNCPGAGWNCTSTNKPVVQMTDPGGSSYFQCTTSSGGSASSPNSCTVVQTGLNNEAKCIEHSTGPLQNCTITQTSSGAGSNKAYVEQIITQSGAATCLTGPPSAQDANQTATITQTTSGGGSNSAAAVQAIFQFTNQGKLQCQDGREVVQVTQHSGTGNNTAVVGQGEFQNEVASGASTGNPINQQQNEKTQPSSVCQTAPGTNDPFDLPNTCFALDQEASGSTGGANNSAVGQLIDEQQIASVAKNQSPSLITQAQGTQDGAEDVERFQSGAAVGHMLALQIGDQDMFAPNGAQQTQDPPLHNPDFQGSNTGDTTGIVQLLEQEANPGAFQTADLNALCSSSGTPPAGCRVHQEVTNNGGTTTNDCGPASFCEATIRCGPEFTESLHSCLPPFSNTSPPTDGG